MEGRAPQLTEGPWYGRRPTDPSVVIRDATPADVALLADVEDRAGERFREAGMASVADDPAPPVAVYAEAQRLGHLWVATVDDEVVGYAWGVDLDGQPHLEQVSVLSEFGGMGIGLGLVNRTARWAAEQGATSLTLSTFRDLAFNGPWYRSIGFEEVPDPDADARWRMVRGHEAEAGLDVAARVIMRRRLDVEAS